MEHRAYRATRTSRLLRGDTVNGVVRTTKKQGVPRHAINQPQLLLVAHTVMTTMRLYFDFAARCIWVPNNHTLISPVTHALPAPSFRSCVQRFVPPSVDETGCWPASTSIAQMQAMAPVPVDPIVPKVVGGEAACLDQLARFVGRRCRLEP